MFRIALIALAIYVVWRILRRPKPAVPATADSLKAPAEMIACARCGTYVILAETVGRGENRYCSNECAGQKND